MSLPSVFVVANANPNLEQFGVVRDFKHSTRRPLGEGTDDSESMIALLRATVRAEPRAPLDEAEVVVELCDAFTSPPRKGYGPTSSLILSALAQGKVLPSESGRMVFAGGSFSNGGLMRVAPVGLRWALLQTNKSAEKSEAAALPFSLADDVRSATRCTHSSEESLEVCELYCRVLAALVSNDGDKAMPVVMKEVLCEEAVAEIANPYLFERVRHLAARLVAAGGDGLKEKSNDKDILSDLIGDAGDQFGELFAIRSSDALAVAFFVVAIADQVGPEEALIRLVVSLFMLLDHIHINISYLNINSCVNWGGDSDTVACIAGALLGAQHGVEWIPDRFLTRLQDREIIVELVDKLMEKHQ